MLAIWTNFDLNLIRFMIYSYMPFSFWSSIAVITATQLLNHNAGVMNKIRAFIQKYMQLQIEDAVIFQSGISLFAYVGLCRMLTNLDYLFMGWIWSFVSYIHPFVLQNQEPDCRQYHKFILGQVGRPIHWKLQKIIIQNQNLTKQIQKFRTYAAFTICRFRVQQ